jgi:hypothetical protein
MLIWPRMEAEFHGGSSHTQGTSTIKKVVALVSDDASAQMTTLSMSSGSYSWLAMHVFVHRNLKKIVISPKTVSSGNAEQ